jgi:hypothetical protein
MLLSVATQYGRTSSATPKPQKPEGPKAQRKEKTFLIFFVFRFVLSFDKKTNVFRSLPWRRELLGLGPAVQR